MTSSSKITCVFTAIGSPWLSPTNTGLGNVLFQISTTIGLGKRFNREASFPELITLRDKYRTLGLADYSSTIFRKINTDAVKDFAQLDEEFACPQRVDHALLEKIQQTPGNIKLMGYLQSHKYFDEHREILLDLFSIDNVSRSYISSKYPRIDDKKCTPISLHVRQCYGYNIRYGPDYFNDAVRCMTEKVENPVFFVFSDDIKWCKENIHTPEGTVYVEGNPDFIDLWLMSLCSHNIISHSTFSWWGAYLNQNPDKMVTFPYDILRLYWSQIYSEPTDLLRLTEHYFEDWIPNKTRTII